MRYQVPQFIEVEDKIFGPLTIKQFVYLAGGAGASYLVYAGTSPYLPIFIVIILVIPVIALALALAFYKVNNRPFIEIMESAVKYYLGSKLYIWKKEPKKITNKAEEISHDPLVVPKLADSKLKDLAWNLNIAKSEDAGEYSKKNSLYNDLGIHSSFDQTDSRLANAAKEFSFPRSDKTDNK